MKRARRQPGVRLLFISAAFAAWNTKAMDEPAEIVTSVS